MWKVLLLPALLWATAALGQYTPADVLTDVRDDLSRLPPELRSEARYLSRPPDLTDEEWQDLARTMSGHCNGLSTAGSIKLPEYVGKRILRIYLFKYGWTPQLWDSLPAPHFTVRGDDKAVAFAVTSAVYRWEYKPELGEGYYHHRLVRIADRVVVGAYDQARDVYFPAEPKASFGKVTGTPPLAVPDEYRGRKAAPTTARVYAPWLQEDAAATKALDDVVNWLQYAGSKGYVVPVVRADWFLVQTATSERKTPGYYDFLGIKNQKDYEDLVRFDTKLARETERRRVMTFSGITRQPRRVEMVGTALGKLWRSFDSVEATGDHNPLVNPDDSRFKFDATEQIAPNPAGMPVFYLGDSKGVRADKAPDNIVKGYLRRHGDGDNVINVNLSCLDCHLGKGESMLKDMDYTNVRRFSGYDPKTLDKLEQQYLNNDIFTRMAQERLAFAGAIKASTTFTPEEYGEKYTRWYASYRDRRWHLGDAAADLGMTAKDFQACLVEEELRSVKMHPSATVLRYGGALPVELYEEVLPELHAIRYRHRGLGK